MFSKDQPDNSSTDAQQEVQEERSTETQLKHDIVCAICEAVMLVDQMEGSLNDFEDVLEYAKKLFCEVIMTSLNTGQKTGGKLRNC